MKTLFFCIAVLLSGLTPHCSFAEINTSFHLTRFDDDTYSLQVGISDEFGNFSGSIVGPDGFTNSPGFGVFREFDSLVLLQNAVIGEWQLATSQEAATGSFTTFGQNEFPEFLQIENESNVQSPFAMDLNIESFAAGTTGLANFQQLGPGIDPSFFNFQYTNPLYDGTVLDVPFEDGFNTSFIDFSTQSTISNNSLFSGTNLSSFVHFYTLDLRPTRLNVSAVPEPSCVILGFAGFGYLLARRRRHRGKASLNKI